MQVDARQLGGLRKHLKPLGALPDAELDALEAALPGERSPGYAMCEVHGLGPSPAGDGAM